MIAGRDRIGLQQRRVSVPERVVSYLTAQCLDRAVMGNLAQRHDRRQLRQRLDAMLQELPAGIDLGADRFVLGRHTPHCIRDHAVHKFHSVIGPGIEGTLCEAVLGEGGIKQITCEIACERPAGTIGSAHARR